MSTKTSGKKTSGDINFASLLEAIDVAGGVNALGRLCGISAAAICKWKNHRQIPINKVFIVEKLTGVSRHRLRSDFYPEDKESR